MNEGYTVTSPYRDDQEAKPIVSAMDLFGTYHVIPAKKGQSERGELLRYFSQKTGYPIKRIVGKVGHLKDIDDLYYIKSACDQYAARPESEGGGPWAKAFHGMLKVPAA